MVHPNEFRGVLEGDTLILRPPLLSDAEDLCKACDSLDTFKYFVSNVPSEITVQAFKDFISWLLTDSNVFPYVVVNKLTNHAIGMSCFMDIRPCDYHLEVGMTWYSPSARGTRVNPECKLIMLGHAFEHLGAEKVTLKCDVNNLHSASAIRKLGAKPEGVLRRHRLTQHGFFRDTAFFSILKEEWPEVKVNLENRLTYLS